MTFCIDCKHHQQPSMASWCHRKLTPSPMDGQPMGVVCVIARAMEDNCGPEAKYFEAKEENKP